MPNHKYPILTKSDFLLYHDAPRHLWANKHRKIEQQSSDFDLHLADEGNRVEGIAHEYLSTILLPSNPGDQLFWQQTYNDGPYEARVDALVKRKYTGYNLYEIKSSTSIDKEIIFDVTFQATILEKNKIFDRFYVLHLNKEYIRHGELDIESLFIAEDVTNQVNDKKSEILQLREEALAVLDIEDSEETATCLSPKECPCPDLCHPGLPEFSIFDIPRLSQAKKIQLLETGVRAAKDIPESFDLNAKQRLVMNCAKTETVHIDHNLIRSELSRFKYPLWFLDYETCISAVPLFENYHPQQQIVFQYSLHHLDEPGGSLRHFGFMSISKGDPSAQLLEHLSTDLGSSGTVIVWNKTFEKTMNQDMARLHPQYEGFLMDVNARIYDLGDIINLGYYIHPGFKGSWSIKHVLPVMVKELTYENLEINKGDQASMAWWNITFGNLEDLEKETLVKNLEKYCEQDTLAMVEIYRRLISL
jgi:hypothetical protein